MPVYNRAATVVRALDSIAAQTRPADRLIVVDNDSTDDSVATVGRWIENYRGPTQVTLLHEKKRGACAARNRGLAAADTDVVIHFDSDDTMRPSLIENAMAPFEADIAPDIVHWAATINTDSGSRMLKYDTRGGMVFHIFHSLLRTQGYAVRRGTIMHAGGWDDSLPLWNDWELGIRLLLANPAMHGTGLILADTYPQPDSLTGSDFHSRGPEREIAIDRAEENILRASATDSKAFVYLRMLRLRRAILAGLYTREGYTPDGTRLLRKALSESSAFDRMLHRIAYEATARGMRGGAELRRLMY